MLFYERKFGANDGFVIPLQHICNHPYNSEALTPHKA